MPCGRVGTLALSDEYVPLKYGVIMFLGRSILLLSLAASLLFLGLACSSDGGLCTHDLDCDDGTLCAASGDCVKADFLRFNTDSLPSALAGRDYATTLEASGGLVPYRWRLVREAPAWLSLDESTGTLSAGASDLVAGSYELNVVLRDQSNAGDGHETEKTLSWRVDNCQQSLPCWTAEGITCMLGVQDCVDGVLQRCVASDPPVFPEDLNRCGSDCRGCDETLANLCVDGRCRCGDMAPCDVGSICCGETTEALCVDSTSLAHCGTCDNHCGLRVFNADGASCTDGQCDYELCLDGWYDCDNDRSNGCEQEQSVAHCSGCHDNCLVQPNIENAACNASLDICLFECTVGWGDCDSNSAGCETPFDSPSNCGGCGIACASTICHNGVDGFFCGCDPSLNDGEIVNPNDPSDNPGCITKEICCENDEGLGACVPHNEHNCFECGDICSPENGGSHCEPSGDDGPWSCLEP